MTTIAAQRRSKLRNFSVTQYKNFADCPRKWFFLTVLRRPFPRTEALDRGVHVHDLIKALILGERVDEADPYLVFARAVKKYWPGAGENYLVEHQLELPTHLGLPWTGYVDLFRYEHAPPLLIDWKTTSNLRYAKTPAELFDDVQLVAYAQYGYQEGLTDEALRAGLVYIELPSANDMDAEREKPRKKPRVPKIKPVFLDLGRGHVAKIWDGTKRVLDEMMDIAECDDPMQVEPNTASCGLYGGCPFRSECGLSPVSKTGKLSGLLSANKAWAEVKWMSRKEGENDMGLLEKLKQKKLEQAAAAGATAAGAAPPAQIAQVVPLKTATAVAVQTTVPIAKSIPMPPKGASKFAPRQVPTGVLPPDAPPRDTVDDDETDAGVVARAAVAEAIETELTEPATPVAKKRGRPAGSKNKTVTPEQAAAIADAEAALERKQAREAAPTPAPTLAPGAFAAPAPAREFVLFVDCMVVKGGGEAPVTLEEWFAPLATELDQFARAEKNLPAYQLLDFSEEKAAIGLAVRDRIAAHGLPPAMLVSSSSSLVRDLLPLLVPHATRVIRALRG